MQKTVLNQLANGPFLNNIFKLICRRNLKGMNRKQTQTSFL